MGASLAAGISLLVWLSPLGQGLGNLSCDLFFLFRPSANVQEAVIIYMDEESFRVLKQEPSNWDRSLHARLLDRLTKDQARLVVFDIWFADHGSPTANAELVRAIKANGKVVLAGLFDIHLSPGLDQGALRPPDKEFLDAGAAWGLAGVQEDHATTVRKHSPNSELSKSLPWAAAQLAGAAITKDPLAASAERWINYYGPHGVIPSVSYCDVTNQAPGFFQNKIVFIGALPKARYAFEEAEDFRTPYTRWGGGFSPGVEIMATTFLNLYRQDWLTRVPAWPEFVLLLMSGLMLGGGFSFCRPWAASGLAVLSLLGLIMVVAVLFVGHQLWFSWMVIAATQIPSALAWSVFNQGKRRRAEKSASLPVAGLVGPFAATDASALVVHDHTVLRSIGRGSYGEVWLARDAIGSFHAVKVVHRNKFSSGKPFEREFEGLKKFTPLSREHESFVHVLHVGINHQAGYFYYIMELADDENDTLQIDPARYAPRTLSSLLVKTPKLPLEQCVKLGLALSSALDYLHRQGLIHRDLKPANIIFVKGKPKLADIGLVTEIAHEERRLSSLGTLGYMAPDGVGTPGADIYSLGKVLYEAVMGRPPEQYPCPSTTILEGDALPELLKINEIILKACEADGQRRYQTAAQMHADLLELEKCLRDKTQLGAK